MTSLRYWARRALRGLARIFTANLLDSRWGHQAVRRQFHWTDAARE